MDIEAERETLVGQFRHMRHPRDDLKSGIEIQRRPRRVHRRGDFVIAVQFADRTGIRGDLHSGGKIASARFNHAFRICFGEIFPEIQHFLCGFIRLFRIKPLFVKKHPGDPPGLRAEAHSVGKPEIIKTKVTGKRLELFRKKCADRRSFRNPAGKSGIRLRISVQACGAGNNTVRKHGVPLRNLPMRLILEFGDGKLRAVIIRCADADRLSGNLPSGFAENFDQAFQPGIRPRPRLRNIFDGEIMRMMLLPFRRIFRTGTMIGASAPVCPFKTLREISGIFKNLTAVRSPQHDRHHIRRVGQILPLRKHVAADRIHGRLGFIPERLGTEFQSHIFQMHDKLLVKLAV